MVGIEGGDLGASELGECLKNLWGGFGGCLRGELAW